METKWTQTTGLTFACTVSVDSRVAHPAQVGFRGVQSVVLDRDNGLEAKAREAKLSVAQQQATGGVLITQPRTTDIGIDVTANVQQILAAYGKPIQGTSVFAAKGSLMAARPLAPATGKASGVPPRGRPV